MMWFLGPRKKPRLENIVVFCGFHGLRTAESKHAQFWTYSAAKTKAEFIGLF
jgi:hypothetical protein